MKQEAKGVELFKTISLSSFHTVIQENRELFE